jgi:predicted patatin/cPLA2 family phospholipase
MSELSPNPRTCLVLEGGALRGVYSSGVQGVLYSARVPLDCVVGTSAGAMNGVNYLAGQPERSFRIDHRYARDKNFMGWRPLLREGQIFNFPYLFGAVNDAYPLDTEALNASPLRFVAVASDLATGDPAYFQRGSCGDLMAAVRASASMPLLSLPTEVDGKLYYDGGPSMPAAVSWALAEGYEKIVVILTRAKGYRKKPFGHATRGAVWGKFRKFPLFREMLLTSPARYNRIMDEIDRLEESGRLFTLRPSQPVTVSRFEKNTDKLLDLFRLGRRDAAARMPALWDYLRREDVPT